MTSSTVTTPLFESTLRALGARSRAEPAWLDDRQRAAASMLRSDGLPHNRMESWRFTSLRPLTRLDFERPQSAGSQDDEARVKPFAETAVSVVTRNGVVAPHAHEDTGVTILSLREALATAPKLVEAHLMRLSGRGSGFSVQNDALFDDAVVVHVRSGGNPGDPVVIAHAALGTKGPTVSYPRVLVVAEPNSSLELVEVLLTPGPSAPHLQNAVTEVVVDRAASVDHVRVVLGAADTFSIGCVAVEQHRDASYVSRTFCLGGKLTRLDLGIRLLGEGASTVLDGLYVAGDGEHVDHHTVVDHEATHATSNQRYRGIVSAGGHAVFDGTVVVRPGASGTVAHQKNENLLLSENATVHAKPHLEIDTDDVTCSHGATVGRLDEAQVFYLRSRGIDEATARAVLVDAFAKDLVELVSSPTVRRDVYELLRRTSAFAHSTEALG